MTGIKNWHSLSQEEVINILSTDAKEGLSGQEVQIRQNRLGPNQLPGEKPLPKIKIFLDQFKSPLVYILLLAGFITLILKEFSDSIIIWSVVGLNAIVGYVQENKASEALKSLKKVVKINARVIRDGDEREISSENLVPGDIVILTQGDKVPADCKIIECHNLKINEAALTGEWLPAGKETKILPEETPLADRDNMAYMGCLVEYGTGRAIVTEIGEKAEMGKIAVLVKETKEDMTPLQRKIAHLGKIIGIAVSVIAVVILIQGVASGNDFTEMFLTAVAIAVAAIPEGLPMATTVILALGMQRILKRKGLVRKLLAAETLGSTSIICSDKTLTLTEGKMVVATVVTAKHHAVEIIEDWPKVKKEEARPEELLALTIAALNSEAFIENPKFPPALWEIKGRPTDRALVAAGAKAGLIKNELERKFIKIDEIPFDSESKLIINLYNKNKGSVLFVSGAPEKILSLSSFVEDGEKPKPLNKKTLRELNQSLEALTEKGLRVIAVAYKEYPKQPSYKKLNDLCGKLVFAGFIGLKDPLRKEVKNAIKVVRGAGIRPVIVTGDHPLTTKAIAEELGFKIKKENIITGKELDELSDEKFQEKIKKIKIYARSEPRHKLRIIEAWQKRGEVVAMTGDGINDAPALKKADIGVVLGSGTDVAKEVADLILLPDSFNIIVAAIEEGRAIIDNIRKVVVYLLADSFTEVILISGALLFGFPLPITAVQILWVNLVSDGLPGMALAFEPKEKDLMKQKPQKKDIPLLTKEMKAIIFIIGIITDLILLGLFFWLWGTTHDLRYVQTMIFAALTVDSLFYIFSCKNLKKAIWHINPFSNKILIMSWLFGVAMLFLAIYLPGLQTLLKTVPLTVYDWTIILGLGIIELFLVEVAKWHFIVKKSFN